MALYGISAYQQTASTPRPTETKSTGKTNQATKSAPTSSTGTSSSSKVETKPFTPIDTKSSLVPVKGDYGYTIGDVKLSEKAQEYYDKLKSKFHNMEFIAVSSDMKGQVAKNAAAYGNANKMVVLIDEEKLERMANDESFRKKYEGIIESSQGKMMAAKMGLSSSGAGITNFGMSVDSNGNESFFATVSKSQDQQKQRIEKKAAEKKAQKAKEKKAENKKAQKERIEKLKDKKAEKADKADKSDKTRENEEAEEKELVTIEAGSFDELISKLQTYSYNNAAGRVMTDSERMMGTQVDFKG